MILLQSGYGIVPSGYVLVLKSGSLNRLWIVRVTLGRVALAEHSEIWNHGDILSVTSSIMPMRPVNFTHYTPIIRFLAEPDRDLVLSPDVITRCRAAEWMEELCGRDVRARLCVLTYTCANALRAVR